MHSDITPYNISTTNKLKKLKPAILAKMQRKFELAVKKNEVHLVELESGKGSSVRVGAENTPVYGDLGVRAHLDHVPLAELGHHHPCGRVVLIVFLTV